MDQLRAIRYFSKVVETGSFTKAAKLFDVPASSLCQHPHYQDECLIWKRAWARHY
ncbi:helix-turn-helix domain-containing protein [Psychrobacter immobilis]|uniref:helix-turn-helix domain-containing protein n=1 Tax=Psychrobacter immobilis TaxID=498 RepID=UPI0039B74357